MPLSVGQRIGKYVVTDLLGEGGMGVVFSAKHEALGREVAIKLLHAEFSTEAKHVARFRQEAEAVSAIGHPHIVSIYDFGRTDDGALYYVMERIRGETLARRAQREPWLSPSEIVATFGQIARALAAAHGRGIVHRDLKPENVILQAMEGGAVHARVLDFGISKMRDGAASAVGATQQGQILGTPAYMAPEQINSALTVDARADVYALGAMLHEVLTGEPPFGRGPLMGLLTAALLEPAKPPSVASRMPVPAAVDAVVLKALAKEPAARQPDAATFAAELEAAWGEAPQRTTTVTVAPAEVAAPASKRRRAWPLPLALLLAVGGGAAGALALRGPASDGSRASTAARRALDEALRGDTLVRLAAVEALGDAGAPSRDLLIAALRDGNPEVRRAAAMAAIRGGPDPAMARALAEAESRSGGAVANDLAAARFLVGDKGAEPVLRAALASADGALRVRAALALADGGALDAGHLRVALAAAPPTVKRSLRRDARATLARLGDEPTLKELRAALAGDGATRLDAALALASAGQADGLAALATITPADPAERALALALRAAKGDPAARGALRAALADPQPAARARAAASLAGVAPDPSLVEPLRVLLGDEDPTVRAAAAAGLLALDRTRSP